MRPMPLQALVHGRYPAALEVYVSYLLKQQAILSFDLSVAFLEDLLILPLVNDWATLRLRVVCGATPYLRQLLLVNVHVLVPPLPAQDLRRSLDGLVDDGLAVEEAADIVSAVGVHIVRVHGWEADMRESYPLLIVTCFTLIMDAYVCT